MIFVIDSTDIKSEVIAKTELFKIVINEVFIPPCRISKTCHYSSSPISKIPRALSTNNKFPSNTVCTRSRITPGACRCVLLSREME